MQLKTIPEDFVVEEIGERIPQESGSYLLVALTKRNLTTERALTELASALNVPRKLLGYAGIKDSRAVTTQHITIKDSPGLAERLEKLHRSGITVRVLGHTSDALGLGMLAGNKFSIVCRKLSQDEVLHSLTKIPNYFDEQRFSKANVQIGRSILQGEFLAAAQLIVANDQEADSRIAAYLADRPNDAVGALRLLPKNLLLLYVHAYQSFLWNEVLRRYIAANDPAAMTIDGVVPLTIPSHDLASVDIPIAGFSSELEEPFAAWYEELLEADNLTLRDFIVRAIPFLTVEGTQRAAFFAVDDFSAQERTPDDLHEGCAKQTLTFSLPKAAYATMVVKCLYHTGSVQGNL